jgi:hypothetical protein
MGLLALIPTKEWFYGALIVGASVLCWHYYDKYESAVNYQRTVKAESEQAKKDAAQTIKDLTTAYNNGLAANKAIYENELQNAAAQHATDVGLVRSAATARRADPVLQGADGLAAAIAGWTSRLGQVESISAGLADAVRQDDAAATECWRDRDSLTGK